MATVCSILLSSGGHQVTMWGAIEETIDRLMQNRENERFLPGVRMPARVRLTANGRECFLSGFWRCRDILASKGSGFE